jgi:peroxiredoxin
MVPTLAILLLAGAALVLLLGGVLSVLLFTAQPEPVTVGSAAPTFRLSDQSGRTHRLADYRGRPVILAFVPDLAPGSKRLLASLNSVQAGFDAFSVKLFAVAPVTPRQASTVKQQLGLKFPILLDEGSALRSRYRTEFETDIRQPATFVVGKTGSVLLPVTTIDTANHGRQVLNLAECCLMQRIPSKSALLGRRPELPALPDVQTGQAVPLGDTKHTRALVLLFISAQCPCSQGYEQRMRELAGLYTPRGVRFIGVASCADETAQQVAEYARRVGLPFTVVKDVGSRLADRLGAKVTPEAFLLDDSGVMRYHGRIDDNRDPEKVVHRDLGNAIDLQLAGRKATLQETPTFGCAITREQREVSVPGASAD